MANKYSRQTIAIAASYFVIMSLLFGMTWWVIASTVLLVLFLAHRDAPNLDKVRSDHIDGKGFLIIIKNGLKTYDRFNARVITPALQRTDEFLQNQGFEKDELYFLSGQSSLIRRHEGRSDYGLVADALRTRNFQGLPIAVLQKCLDNMDPTYFPGGLPQQLDPGRHCLLTCHKSWYGKFTCNQGVSLELVCYFSNAFKNDPLLYISTSQRNIVVPDRLSWLLREIDKNYGNHTGQKSLIDAFHYHEFDLYSYMKDKCGVPDTTLFETWDKIVECYEWVSISEWSGHFSAFNSSIIEQVAGQGFREKIRNINFEGLPN